MRYPVRTASSSFQFLKMRQQPVHDHVETGLTIFTHQLRAFL
jgi:hypothetical protein